MWSWCQKKFSRKLALAFCSTIILAMAVSGFLLSRSFKRELIHELTASLHTQARLIAPEVASLGWTPGESRRLHGLAHAYGRASGNRVTFIDPTGVVLGESDLSFERLAHVENHRNRPEVQQAVQGQEGWVIRHSETVGVDLLYAALPVFRGPQVIGVVRVAMPLTQVHHKVGQIRQIIAWTTVAMTLVAVVVVLFLAHSLAKPVREMSRVADTIAQGRLGARVGWLPADEHGHLGRTLNALAERVQSTIQELSREKAELTMILSTMVEAVVAVDADKKILAINPAFSRLFGVSPDEAQGRPFYEVLRHAQLSTILQCALGECKGCREEVQLFTPHERIFEADALPFTENGAARGALLVLHDITQIRRLERVRRDFVANVSHELRTPVAAIKGSAESLLEGALDEPAHRREFTQAIKEDADRLAYLVDDLLDLAAIESGKRRPRREPVSLLDLARETAKKLHDAGAAKRVAVEVRTDTLPLVPADREQIRQVFANLIGNAIKYNREHGTVTVWAETDGSSATVFVQDTGLGIPKQDLLRIFERFYRVDKARSRELGGTGLGLAIVKHIVEAHGGAVAVESVEGEGSTFRFSLPVSV